MKDCKKVSLIIPAYNAEKTIARLLYSVLKQTYKNIEVLIIDDGSSDSTYNICASVIKGDPRFYILKQTNAGVSAARNKGLEIAKGYYILFADADDYLEENCIEILVSQERRERCDLVCGSYRMLKRRRRRADFCNNTIIYSGESYREFIFEITNKIPYAPWGKLFLKSIIDLEDIRFPDNIPYGEDGIFLLRYLRVAKSVIFTDIIVYNYDYTNGISAANRYYPDFNVYLKRLAEERTYTCNSVSRCDYTGRISTDYFNRCISYYILNERRKTDLINHISASMDFFPDAMGVGADHEYWKKRDFEKYIRKWKISNGRYYIYERGKKMVHTLSGDFL